MRPALFVRKQIFYRRPKLIVPLGEDEGIPSQGAVELIQFVDGVGAWDLERRVSSCPKPLCEEHDSPSARRALAYSRLVRIGYQV